MRGTRAVDVRAGNAGGVAVFCVVFLLALQPRPLVTSVGVLHGQITSATGMSEWVSGALVAAPVFCFAAGGLLTTTLRRRWGTTRTVTASLLVLFVALVARVAGDGVLLLAGTVVACLAVAVISTLIPPIVKSIPHARRRARLTSSWGTVLGSGSAAGALVTPSLAAQTSWRWAVGSWALLALAALLVWLMGHRRMGAAAEQTTARRVNDPRPATTLTFLPSLTAWSVTVHFGLVCGYSFFVMGRLPVILADIGGVASSTAQSMFGWSMTIGLPIAAIGIPALLGPSSRLHVRRGTPLRGSPPSGATRLGVDPPARGAGQSYLVAVLAAPSVAGTVGLLFWPTTVPWIWAILIGVGTPSVVVALMLISLRTKESDEAAALSAMVQGVGYLIAGITITVASALHAATGSWTGSLVALTVVLAGQVVAGWRAGRPGTITASSRDPRTPVTASSAAPVVAIASPAPRTSPRTFCHRPTLHPMRRHRTSEQKKRESP